MIVGGKLLEGLEIGYFKYRIQCVLSLEGVKCFFVYEEWEEEKVRIVIWLLMDIEVFVEIG